jgi:hypothetical protein
MHLRAGLRWIDRAMATRDHPGSKVSFDIHDSSLCPVEPSS